MYHSCNSCHCRDPLMYIRRGTTPVVAFMVGEDLRDWETIIVTIFCRGECYNFTKERLVFVDPPYGLHGVVVRLPLTQEETLALMGRCAFQLRAANGDGAVVASGVLPVMVADVVEEGVIA